jgi:hypothetical protein
MAILQLRGDVLTLTRPPSEDLHPETRAWRASALAADGTFGADSLRLADRLVRGLNAATYNSKVVWLVPFLGANLAAAITPLRDSLGAGRPLSYKFSDGDFDQARGLQSDGASKYLDTRIQPYQLGPASNANGGLGWWELEVDFTGLSAPMLGYAYNPGDGTRGFYLHRNSTLRRFGWNQDLAGYFASNSSAGVNGHYYGQRSAANRRTLYIDAVLDASSASSDPAIGNDQGSIWAFGYNSTNVAPPPRLCKTRCGVAYMTTGDLTTTEIAQFHALLRDTLLRPTGRI